MAKVIKSVTLNPGEAKVVAFEFMPTEAKVYLVSVDGLTGSFTAMAPPGLQLISAYFDNGQPMLKKPKDTFTVTLKIKSNLTKDWSPSNILFGFGPGAPNTVIEGFTFAGVVWGRNWFTGEVDPQSCWTVGYWPLATWPVIPAGATKEFKTTYGLCPTAPAGVYDGYILMQGDGLVQKIVFPSILTVVWPQPRLTLLSTKLYNARVAPRQYGGNAIWGKIDITIKNDEGRTLTGQSPDYVDLQVGILRASNRESLGFVRFSRDIPPGTNTLTLEPKNGWGVTTAQPGTLDYIIKIKLVLLGWPGDPYVSAEFRGTTTLG